MELVDHLTDEDVKAFEPEAKIGLLATVGAGGLPHVSLITTLRARTPTGLMWGQFCEGRSKANVRDNPKTAYLVMNTSQRVWRGTATWTHAATEGADYDLYNQTPMFRYNSYFGIHTVHYMDLHRAKPAERLGVPAIAAGTLYAAGATWRSRSPKGPAVMNPWTVSHFNKPSTLKFISYVRDDGFPWIIPVVPAVAADDRRLVVARTAYSKELAAIREGCEIAVFALNMQMESVLVRGSYHTGRAGLGRVYVDWVYNSMPPKPGQIYPPVPLRAVRWPVRWGGGGDERCQLGVEGARGANLD